MILDLNGIEPQLGKDVFIAPNAWVIGDAILGDNVSVFFGAVLRGDILQIKVGSKTNIQEHALLHTSHGRAPTIVGEEVTIGHRAIVHGCTVGDRSLVGMGATILDEAEIGEECVIGANSLILEGAKIPPRSLVVGSPGKVIRQLDDAAVAGLRESAATYVETGRMFIQRTAALK
ncbi:MAG: gamma carbonic anhydrase family protein [Bdellovibrionales bacterium]|nr:gamma carbonic anhydrase family protein [Bdellovibrionales bacterium]